MLDPQLLETFVAVAETGSFTLAALRVSRTQSTVSGHIKRLEEQLQRGVILRTTHGVALTADGNVLLDLARETLRTRERMASFVTRVDPRGRLRLGLCDDFSLSGLPSVLDAFARENPSIDLELTIGLSIPIYERYDSGQLDVILVKRRSNDARGTLALRDRLVWLGRPALRPDATAALPLLLFPPPSITRSLALQALEQSGRNWRIACTSHSLSGLYASAMAGLGLLPHAVGLAPSSLSVLEDPSLPDMAEVDFVVIGTGVPGSSALVAAILDGIGDLRS